MLLIFFGCVILLFYALFKRLRISNSDFNIWIVLRIKSSLLIKRVCKYYHYNGSIKWQNYHLSQGYYPIAQQKVMIGCSWPAATIRFSVRCISVVTDLWHVWIELNSSVYGLHSIHLCRAEPSPWRGLWREPETNHLRWHTVAAHIVIKAALSADIQNRF